MDALWGRMYQLLLNSGSDYFCAGSSHFNIFFSHIFIFELNTYSQEIVLSSMGVQRYEFYIIDSNGSNVKARFILIKSL